MHICVMYKSKNKAEIKAIWEEMTFLQKGDFLSYQNLCFIKKQTVCIKNKYDVNVLFYTSKKQDLTKMKHTKQLE